jgi:hypothetical protein
MRALCVRLRSFLVPSSGVEATRGSGAWEFGQTCDEEILPLRDKEWVYKRASS